MICENGLPVIGIYTVSNTGSIVVHKIEDDRVEISLNGNKPEWVEIIERWIDCDEDYVEEVNELGFMWGELFIPFSEILRI